MNTPAYFTAKLLDYLGEGFTKLLAPKVSEGCWCFYLPEFVTLDVFPDVEERLLSLPWETKRTARHEYFMSLRPGEGYSYGGMRSGVTNYTAKPFSIEAQTIMNSINRVFGTEFNACFLNKYDDQHQHLGWHADDFEGMRADQPIAVVSFGAEREIWFKDKLGFFPTCPKCLGGGIKDNGAPCYSCPPPEKAPPGGKQPEDQRILLQRGSLLIMPAGLQDTHLHRIPKHPQPCGWRISLTFRSFH